MQMAVGLDRREATDGRAWTCLRLRRAVVCGWMLGLGVCTSGCATLRFGESLANRFGPRAALVVSGEAAAELPVAPQVEVPAESTAVPDAVRLGQLLQRAAEEPRRAVWQEELASYWLQAGQLQEAEFSAVRAISLDQHATQAWRVRAAVASQRSEWRLALACYQQAVNSGGEDDRTLSCIAHCYQQLGESRRALSACERALELAPRGQPSPELIAQWGRLLAELGQSRRAIALLEAAVARPEAPAVSWIALSEVQALAGKTAAARSTLARARELFPEMAQEKGWDRLPAAADTPLAVWR